VSDEKLWDELMKTMLKMTSKIKLFP